MEEKNRFEIVSLSEEVLKEMNKRTHLKWTYCSPVHKNRITLISADYRRKTHLTLFHAEKPSLIPENVFPDR